MAAGAMGSLVEGYCDEFVKLAASLAQTLEQASMRNVSLADHRPSLQRVERGMRALADAIGSLLDTEAAPGIAERAPRQPSPPPANETGPAAHGNCILNGTSDSLPIASVFQFLGRIRKNGVLRVTMGHEVLTFRVNNGEIAGTASNRPPPAERLGEILVELGFVQRHHLQNLRPGEGPLGQRLVQAGAIDEQQLGQALQVQIHRRCQRASTAKAATYSFHEQAHPAGDGRVRARAADLRLATQREPAPPPRLRPSPDA